MKEGQIYQMWLRILVFALGLSYDLSKFSDSFTRFFDFERP